MKEERLVKLRAFKSILDLAVLLYNQGASPTEIETHLVKELTNSIQKDVENEEYESAQNLKTMVDAIPNVMKVINEVEKSYEDEKI